jgi:hypothetical protein
VNSQVEVLVQRFVDAGKLCGDDEQFRRATQFWTGALRVGVSGQSVIYRFESGHLVSVTQTASVVKEQDNEFGFEASDATWRKLLSGPSNVTTKKSANWLGDLMRTGDRDTYWRQYPAMRRLLELMAESTL